MFRTRVSLRQLLVGVDAEQQIERPGLPRGWSRGLQGNEKGWAPGRSNRRQGKRNVATANSKPVCWLAILPWLKLSSEVGLGNLRFVPVEASHPEIALPELSPISKDCAQVLSTFRLTDKHSIEGCTVLVPRDWNVSAPPDGQAQRSFFHAANLLMLAAFASNRYGEINPQNANARMFQLHIAMFSSPPGYLPLYQRLRDGRSAVAGGRWGDALFHVPWECNPPCVVSVDEGLAAGLGRLSDSDDLTRRLTLALPFFGWANTNAETVSWEIEIIALVAAFEALLRKSGPAGVAHEVEALLRQYGSVRASQAVAARPNIFGGKGDMARREDWFLHACWVRDLYRVRNPTAHGGGCHTGKLAWALDEHLTMGAFLFPNLVKLLLANDGLYELTWDDRAACDAVDMLLAETDWFTHKRAEDDEDDHTTHATTTWAATLRRASRARYAKESAEVAASIMERHGTEG